MTMKLIKLREVTRITSLSRSTIYQAITDGQFPKPLRTGARGRRVGGTRSARLDRGPSARGVRPTVPLTPG